MRRFTSFFVALSFFASIAAFAQNDRAPADSNAVVDEKQTVTTEETAEAATDEKTEKAPRVYPIAAGVWYPGDPIEPEKAFRYYRIRCWPGCHQNSKYGVSPAKKPENHPEKKEKQ